MNTPGMIPCIECGKRDVPTSHTMCPICKAALNFKNSRERMRQCEVRLNSLLAQEKEQQRKYREVREIYH